jgi:glycosyltransferase involved in cell wall biosynthesis
MKNIIILTIDSPFESMGGLGVSLYEMIRNIEGYNFYSFGSGKEGKEGNLTHYNLGIANDMMGCIEEYEKVLYKNIGKIIYELEDMKIECVNTFDWVYIPLGIKLKKILKYPLVHTFALSPSKQIGKLYEYYGRSKIIIENNKKSLIQCIKYENLILDKADSLVFVSEYYKSLFDKNYKKKYNVIHNGVDHSYYNKIIPPEKYVMPGNKNTLKILYIGRLAIMKNIENLINTEIPDGIELLVAGGERGSVKWLVEKVRDNPPKNIKYIGFISGEYKAYILQNVDAVIVPSIHEPFGIVALEAIASKTLLLSSRSSGMAEYISEDMCINCG